MSFCVEYVLNRSSGTAEELFGSVNIVYFCPIMNVTDKIKSPPNIKRITRLIVYLLILWLLLWSSIRLLIYLDYLMSESQVGPVVYFGILAVGALLTVGWSIGGPLFLSNQDRLTAGLAQRMDRSRSVYWIAWMLPAFFWILMLILFTLSGTPDAALVDGPILVLAILGLVSLRFLVKQSFITPGRERMESRSEDTGAALAIRTNNRTISDTLATGLALLGLTITVLLLFRKALFDGDVIIFGHDVVSLHYMFEQYVRESFRSGQIPTWNPYLFSGYPVLGHPQNLLFYPPQLLLRFLPLNLNLSLSWSIAFHIWIAGVGMFALSRRLGLQIWIAFLCAMVYMLNSDVLLRVYAGHPWLLYATCWLPLVWMFIIITLETGRVAAIIAAAVGTAMIILTGHPTYPAYIFLYFGLYTLFVCYESWRKQRSRRLVLIIVGRFFGIMVLAVGLSAIQIIPSIAMSQETTLSQGYNPSWAQYLGLSVSELLAIFFPRFYFAAAKQRLYWELVPYMGALFILLIPMAYIGKQFKSMTRFLVGIVLISLAIALGGSIGIYPLLYTLILPFRMARIPPRSLVMLIPVVTLLGGIGLQAIGKRDVSAKWFSFLISVYASISLFILGMAAGQWLGQNTSIIDQFPSTNSLQLAQLGVGSLVLILVCLLLAGRFLTSKKKRDQIVISGVLVLFGLLLGLLIVPDLIRLTRQLPVLAITLAASALVLTILFKYGPNPLVFIALVGLIVVDIGIFAFPHITAVEPPTFFQDERLVLQDVDLEPFNRVWSTVGDVDQYMLGSVSHIDGYNSGILFEYEAFLRGLSSSEHIIATSVLPINSTVDPRALDFLGVKFVITSKPIDDPALQYVSDRDSYYLYENADALPRAFMVYESIRADTRNEALDIMRKPGFDFASQVVLIDPVFLDPGSIGESDVQIDHYSATSGELVLQVETTKPGIVVMSEPYYGERKVWVNGEEADLLKVNVGFVGVAVPAGSHQVRLGYAPTSLYIGAAITALTGAIIAIMVIVSGFCWQHKVGRFKSDQWALRK
ncbi:MAG: YfhO family protein [Candidatus Promineifilaceae bacterium]